MSTLTICIVVLFVVGYLCIALESLTRVNKAAIALLMCVGCWTLLMFGPAAYYPEIPADGVIHHIAEVIEHHLGDAAGTLFFLMGAMTIVEIVDTNGGFNFVRDTMKTRSKRKLLWRVAFMTFFLSAILDNLTTSIVMIMVLRKLVQERTDRLIYAALVIIAANSGGAFSPIGDVTLLAHWRRYHHHAVDQGCHHYSRRYQRNLRSFAYLDDYPCRHSQYATQRQVRQGAEFGYRQCQPVHEGTAQHHLLVGCWRTDFCAYLQDHHTPAAVYGHSAGTRHTVDHHRDIPLQHL